MSGYVKNADGKWGPPSAATPPPLPSRSAVPVTTAPPTTARSPLPRPKQQPSVVQQVPSPTKPQIPPLKPAKNTIPSPAMNVASAMITSPTISSSSAIANSPAMASSPSLASSFASSLKIGSSALVGSVNRSGSTADDKLTMQDRSFDIAAGMERAMELYNYVDEEHKDVFLNQCVIKEGTVVKHDRGGGTSKPHLFLTTQHLLLTELEFLSRKVKFRRKFKLTDMRVRVNGIRMLVETPVKSFNLESGAAEILQWEDGIKSAIQTARSNEELPGDYEKGLKFSAAWVEDTPDCNDCKRNFTLLVRRHHCRNCGKCICGSCCVEKVRMMEVDANKFQKVCNACAAEFKEKRTKKGGYGAAAM